MSRITPSQGYKVSNGSLVRPLMYSLHSTTHVQLYQPYNTTLQRIPRPSLIPTALPANDTHAKNVRHVSRQPPCNTCKKKKHHPTFPRSHTHRKNFRRILHPNISHRDSRSRQQKSQQHSVRAGGRWARHRYLALDTLALVSSHHTHTWQNGGKYRNM
jgi:hypothetical protein